MVTWHWRPGAEEAIAPGVASLVQLAPAVPPCSTVPSPSRASIAPAPAASASGALATGALIRPVRQVLPALLVTASGEKVSPWLGRNATLSEAGPPAATSPPLLATPGGVTSFHGSLAAARVNSSQNWFAPAAEPPIATIAQVASLAVVIEVASEAVPAGAGAAAAPDPPPEQPASTDVPVTEAATISQRQFLLAMGAVRARS